MPIVYGLSTTSPSAWNSQPKFPTPNSTLISLVGTEQALKSMAKWIYVVHVHFWKLKNVEMNKNNIKEFIR